MRILLADHESNVRYGLRVLLEERSEFEVVAEVADAEELLAQIQATCPDLVLLSWGLPGLARADLLPALRSDCDNLYVIVLSGRPEARQAVLAAGANAFISKVEPPEKLLTAIASAENTYRKGG
jgi:DNA-binding NarL/FixJ family response regulator